MTNINSLPSPSSRLLALPSQAVSSADSATSSVSDVFIPRVSQDEVPLNIKKALEAAGRPYYDEARDQKEVAQYYGQLDASQLDPSQLYSELNKLVSRTHHEKFSFDPEKRLFPWVDLRPNLRLQSIYSAQKIEVDSPIKSTKAKDFIIKAKVQAAPRPTKDGSVGEPRTVTRKLDLRGQAQAWTEALLKGPTDALQIAQRIAAVEGNRYYNGEHSVPQYFFDHDRVPKGDLHHLFACERDSNSHRGCRPYSPVERTPENRSLDGWAPKQLNQFEPDAGKGAVARATLYFLVRYPGEIGERPGEYTKKDLDTLLRWHRENPVSLYEHHRNQAIAEMQGNRNPFIDHPEWADKVDFTRAFGAYGQNPPDVPVGKPI